IDREPSGRAALYSHTGIIASIECKTREVRAGKATPVQFHGTGRTKAFPGQLEAGDRRLISGPLHHECRLRCRSRSLAPADPWQRQLRTSEVDVHLLAIVAQRGKFDGERTRDQ